MTEIILAHSELTNTIYALIGKEKIDITEQAIAEVKAVKALEQDTGHWIYKNDNWHCSECDETPKTYGYVGSANFMKEHFKFCNHCGARMSEVSE